VIALRLLALPLAFVAFHSYDSSVKPLPAPLERILDSRFWEPGCPVPLSDLRLLTVTHWDFDGREREGQLVVHRDSARQLATVFRKLHALKFPIRHLRLDDMYGPRRARPADNDISGSFHCRKAVPSPCGTGSGNWSNHAYGHAIDLNPNENPYVGCGAVHDPRSARYVDRTPLRKGMVTPAVVRAFASIGWGWGGSWTGDTKDYMHFSTTGG
jgi:D-alanyl-D-alanine carboxypeptidase